MRTVKDLEVKGHSLSDLKLFEKLPYEQPPLSYSGKDRDLFIQQSRVSAILNLIVSGSTGVSDLIEEAGRILMYRIYRVEAGTYKRDEKSHYSVESLFPGGKFRPYIQWKNLYTSSVLEAKFNDEYTIQVASHLDDQMTNNFENVCVTIATFALNLARMFRHDGSSGKSFSLFQDWMVLNRESGWISANWVHDEGVTLKWPSANSVLNALFEGFIRPSVGTYNDPTDSQRAAGQTVNANGPYSVRIGTMLHYLHDLGWSEANSKDVNPKSFTDADIMQWVKTAPLVMQSIVANAGACNAQRGDMPYNAADGRLVRTWSPSSTFKNAAWRSLFYGNPFIEKAPFAPHNALHNSPLYHTKMEAVPDYFDKLFEIKRAFANYKTNFRDVCRDAVKMAEDGRVTASQAEINAMKKAIESKSDYVGWYAEMVQSGPRMITGKERSTTFDMLEIGARRFFIDLPFPTDVYGAMDVADHSDAALFCDLFSETDIDEAVDRTMCPMLRGIFLNLLHSCVTESLGLSDLPEEFYEKLDVGSDNQIENMFDMMVAQRDYMAGQSGALGRIRSTGLVQYLDDLIKEGSYNDPVPTTSDKADEAPLFQLDINFQKDREKSRFKHKPDLNQLDDVKLWRKEYEAKVTVNLNEF